MRLAIDLDGVLCNFNQAFSKVLGKYSKAVIPVDLPTFPSCWDWPLHYGVNPEEEAKAWREVNVSEIFWKDLQPMPTAEADLKALAHVASNDHEIYFLTMRGNGVNVKRQSEEWLWRYRFHFPTVIPTYDKATLARMLKVDVLLDDCPKVLEHAQQLRIPRVYGFAQPYNNGTITSVREMLIAEGLWEEEEEYA